VKDLWRVLEVFQLAWAQDGRRLSISLVLMVLQSAAAPLSAGALGAVVDAVVAGDAGGAAIAGALVGVCIITSLTGAHFAHIYYFELGDLMLIRLQQRLIGLSNGSPTLDHHERPDYADRLQVLREELGRTGSTIIASLLGALSLAIAMAITAVMLARVNPWLLCLPIAAVPPLVLGRRSELTMGRAREAAAQANRRARHLFHLATDPASSKELRSCNLEQQIRRRHAAAWAEASGTLWRGEIRALGLRILGQSIFALAYLAATLLVVWDAVVGHRSPGSVILAITLAAQVNQQVTAAVTLHQDLQRLAKALADLAWIKALVSRPARVEPSSPPPAELTEGIAFEAVTFAYPGTDRNVLEGVNLRLASGSIVAIVGENGAGKSTLVKLLCGLYEASGGTIRIDGVDMRRFDVDAWRERISAGFQDFVRFEFRAREAVGVGHLPDIGSDRAVLAALSRARAEEVLQQLDQGLDTEIGKSNPNGRELSGGQWQKLALGRAMMRERPLLLVLDEPTSALDAQAEHQLFERYAASAKRVGEMVGAITVLVSHRFSTAKMADQILVVSDRRISEAGTHAELMQRGGLYADLYSLQARAYQ
jgi:ATP-binding cassette subfamily B protein